MSSSVKIGSKQVYLAHPIIGNTVISKSWVKQFKRDFAGSIVSTDFKLFDPCSKKLEDGVHDAKAIVTMNKREIAKSAALVAYADVVSAGVSMEIMYAKAIGIPIIVFAENRVSSWIIVHANTVCDTNEAVLRWINKLV